jgi:hypothetical protein
VKATEIKLFTQLHLGDQEKVEEPNYGSYAKDGM